MANLVTLIRLLLVFVISALALYATPRWQLLNVPLILIGIISDGLDGIVARMRHEESIFGAVFDIAVDRVVEIVLWLVLAKLGLVPIWIAIIFVTRGILVDSLRTQRTAVGFSPFSIMQTSLGKFLVASRSMRFFYGAIKLITFAWLLLMLPMPALWPQFWLANYYVLNVVSNVLIYVTLALCLIRGVPVLVEILMMEKSRI